MKIKTRNLIIGGALAIPMMFGLAFGGAGLVNDVAFADPDPLPTLTYELTEAGVLNFDPIPNEATYPDTDGDDLPDVYYWAYVYQAGHVPEGVYDDTNVEVTGTFYYPDEKTDGHYSFDLKGSLIKSHLPTGEYVVRIFALDYEDFSGNLLTQISSCDYSHVSTQVPYATPTNLQWAEEGQVLTWDPIEFTAGQHTRYEILIYRYENEQKVYRYDTYTTENSFDFVAKHCTLDDAYTYEIKVKVLTSYGLDLGRTSSDWATIEYPVPAVEPEPEVPAVEPAGLGAGAIAGIVIASVCVASIGAFALVWFVFKKKTWADFVALFKKK